MTNIQTMQPQFHNSRSYTSPVKMAIPPTQHSDNDRSSGELRALDCNLTSLCDHIQLEGFNSGSFSDIVVHAMGATYRLHRLILSRSSYFRFALLLRSICEINCYFRSFFFKKIENCLCNFCYLQYFVFSFVTGSSWSFNSLSMGMLLRIISSIDWKHEFRIQMSDN